MSNLDHIPPGYTGPPPLRSRPRTPRPVAPAMSMATAVQRCLRQYVVFSGRARRAEYWKFMLAILLVQVLIVTVRAALSGPRIVAPFPTQPGVAVYDAGLTGVIFGLLTCVPTLAVTWRRMHDRNRSGWWIGWFTLLFVLVHLSIFGRTYWSYFSAGVVVPPLVSPFHFLAAFAAIVICSLWLFIQLVRAGTPGPNRFGPDPLEVTP